MTDWKQPLRRVLHHGSQVIQGLDEFEAQGVSIDQITLPDLVILGQRTWMVVRKATRMLEEIKSRFRREAGHNSMSFSAPDGTSCSVVAPASQAFSLRKDADIKALKDLLGVRFPHLFVEVTTFRPTKDFAHQLGQCTPDEQKALVAFLDVEDRTPRVVFTG